MTTGTSPTEHLYGLKSLMTQTTGGMICQVLPGEHRRLQIEVPAQMILEVRASKDFLLNFFKY
jgi:hypothetical protein